MEFTQAQHDRIDAVDNACHKLLCDLAGEEIEWNIEYIGEVADICQEIICDELKLMTEMEFKPFVQDEETKHVYCITEEDIDSAIAEWEQEEEKTVTPEQRETIINEISQWDFSDNQASIMTTISNHANPAYFQ